MYEDDCARLCEMGHIGLQNELRVMCRKKKPVNRWLTVADKSRNQCIFYDCALVKICFWAFIFVCCLVYFLKNGDGLKSISKNISK